MKKCNADDHPYCTYRVDAGESVCAAGHPQKIALAETLNNLNRLPGYAQLTGSLTGNLPEPSATGALHLHFSGYDPRAAGGRQMIKLELRGAISEGVVQVDVQLRSELIATGVTVQRFERSLAGLWRPLLIAFSSKNKEYGQYQLAVELSVESLQRRWSCCTIILVPPPATSLTEIHRVFLGSQKNVKVLADDGSIAKLSGLNSYTHGDMDIEISAKNAALTQVELSAPVGKYEIALGSIAWDEDLIEEAPVFVACTLADKLIASIPNPDTASNSNLPAKDKYHASLINDAAQAPSQIRLLALDHWVLGRLDLHRPAADVLLAHRGKSSAENGQLSRRISASHAIIRRTENGAEMIDVSRYGTLLDGHVLKKDQPTPLITGMHIELCASMRGIARLQVISILPHVIILQRKEDETNIANAEIFYLLTPETKPDPSTPGLQGLPPGLPLLFHFAGKFWHRDPHTKHETVLDSSTALSCLSGIALGCRYSNAAYEDLPVRGFGQWRLHATAPLIAASAAPLGKNQ